jgi:hypothetical protein
MKKIKLLTLLTTALCLCSCEEKMSIIKDNGSKQTDTECSKNSENDTYIVGSRVFDKNYYCNEIAFSRDSNYAIEGLPQIKFSNSGASFETESGEVIGANWQLYLADVNLDGYLDMCGCRSLGSGIVSFRAYVYDIHNERTLLEKDARGQFDYYFDLDENNFLCLVECKTRSHYYTECNQLARFSKKHLESPLEWGSLDYKVTGLMFNHETARIAKSGTANFDGFVLAYVGASKDFPLAVRYIEYEKVEGPNFTFEFTEYDVERGNFAFNLYFSGTGHSKINLKFFDLTTTIEIDVTEDIGM